MDDVRPITEQPSTAVALAADAPAPIKRTVEAGGPLTAIVPRDLDEAWRLSVSFCKAGMVPDSYKGRDDNETAARVMIGVMKGMEVGLAPVTALSTICIVNNRPSIWGDGAVALVQRSGKLEWIKERLDGEHGADNWTAVCEVKRVGQVEPYIRRFAYGDAKRAKLATKGPWVAYPARMLQMRARAWAIRDAFADALSGLSIAEEAQDIPPAPPPVTDTKFLDAGMPAALPTPSTETPAEGQAAAPTAPATGATIAPGAAAAPLDWCPSLPKSKDDAAFKAGEIVKRLTPCSAEDRMAWFRVEKHAALHAAITAQLGPEHDKVKAIAKLWQEAA